MSSYGIKHVIDGVAFGESVRWHDDRVWFCDWVDGDVVSIGRDGAGREVHATLPGFPISIDWDPNGRLLVVDGAGRRLLRIEDGRETVLADLSSISASPWNEIAAHPSGSVYVNGIGYDMMAGEPASTGQIAVVEPDGRVEVRADDLHFPNGMVVSRDGSTLLVAESHAERITAFTIADDGTLSDRRVFAAIPGSAPDGIALGPDGSVWYADVPNRHCRLLSPSGQVVDTIELDRGCFSCATSAEGEIFIAATVWDDSTFATRRGVIARAANALGTSPQ